MISSKRRELLGGIPEGSGWALDLGGGSGLLGPALRRKGYRYVNLDIRSEGRDLVRGDAERLPFKDASVQLVVSCDSLEHFLHPRRALREVRRVLEPGGTLIVWVPFLHPFHGDDFFRYTPLGLQALLTEASFSILSLEAPRWIFTLLGQLLVAALQRLSLRSPELPIERVGEWLDRLMGKLRLRHLGFAAVYMVIAKPCA